MLYVCADRGALMPSLAAQRAEEEGRSFAQQRGLTITEVVTDEYGEPDPCCREGWQRVRDLAGAGAVAAVLVRWPASIAPESAHEFRHRETRWLQEHGVRVRYTWAPLAATGGEAR
ncbi:hypothetical protein J7I98_38350 [Streptomyces sp. ISL-98]|nr:hypothetical protein [Streptomyces sp. ISL-98]